MKGLTGLRVMFLVGIMFVLGTNVGMPQKVDDKITILSYSVSKNQPNFYLAAYTTTSGIQLRARKMVSDDNGRRWHKDPSGIKRLKPIESYSRRVPVSSIYDSNKDAFITFFNALDSPKIPKYAKEPPAALKRYYIRYRVSKDNGATWLYDEPIMEAGRTNPLNPFPGISRGENAFYLGDYGSKPIILDNGHILLPVQATVLPNSKKEELNKNNLYNPAGAHTYTEVLMLDGKWVNDKLEWTLLSRLKADYHRTTRGLIEPTIVQLDNRKILAVMRGSNGGNIDSNYQIPSYKWFSYSEDGGHTWSVPKPWTYDNGAAFYSPSSMSLLFKHSSGRVFWIGNISEKNPRGNKPRYPLVIGEINRNNMTLIKSSVEILDTHKKRDKGKGTMDLSHVTAIENRVTNNIIIVFSRRHSESKTEWVTTRISL